MSALAQLPTLEEGDIVDIIAPGYGASTAYIKKAAAFLEEWGLVPRVPDDLLGQHPYFSHDDAHRSKHLITALQAADSKAIWCLRGGYGTARLLPALDQVRPITVPKLFIGYSDITALHLFLYQNWGWPTLHGPTLTELVDNKISKKDVTTLHNIMFGLEGSLSFQLSPCNDAASNASNIKAPVIGGNLSLLQCAIGTYWQPPKKSHLLFIEEVDECGYRIDRMLTHLQQAGLIDHCAGIILGDFINNAEENGDNSIKHALDHFSQYCRFPVFSCPGIGHGKEHHALPLGIEGNIQANTLNICLSNH